MLPEMKKVLHSSQNIRLLYATFVQLDLSYTE